MELSELMETPPTDVTGFGPPASDSGLPLPADADITAKKTGGCKTSTVEHSDSPTLRLGGKSNQSMGAELDPRDPAPGNYYHTDPMRPTRPRATPPDARDIGLPSTGRRAYSKLTGTLLATVAAAPVALAVRGFRGTASSPKTMGRVLVLLAMISTASGWKLPSHYETLDGQITQRDDRTVDVGEEETEEMIRVSRVTTITEHESPITRDRRRLASSCNGFDVGGSYSDASSGYKYATIDGTSYSSTSIACQSGAYSLPTGWEVAPADSDGIRMARVGGWGCHVVVYSNGDAYGTSNYNEGLWNSGMLVTSTLNGAPAYGVGSCSLRALIRAPSSCLEALSVTSELTLDTDASPNGFSYDSLFVAAGATLKATGSNPLIIDVSSSVDIQGTIDIGLAHATHRTRTIHIYVCRIHLSFFLSLSLSGLYLSLYLSISLSLYLSIIYRSISKARLTSRAARAATPLAITKQLAEVRVAAPSKSPPRPSRSARPARSTSMAATVATAAAPGKTSLAQ